MRIADLNREQINSLKTYYVSEIARNENRIPSYMELISAPNKVSDEVIFKLFKDITFSKEDFSLN